MLATSIAAAKRASTDDTTIKPEIVNNINAEDKDDRHNVFCLFAIGVNVAIKLADDERNVMNIQTIHQKNNVGNEFITATYRRINKIRRDGKQVHFRNRPTIATYHKHNKTAMLTHNSGADGHFLRNEDRKKFCLPIFQVSAKKLGVTNDGACNSKYVTILPSPQISNRAAEADTFKESQTPLMSVGKTAEDGNVSIFTKDGVTVYKEEDVLITCQRNPILVSKKD